MKHIKLFLLSALTCGVCSYSALSMAWEKDELLIWMKPNLGNDGMIALGKRFEEKTGHKVKVVTPAEESALTLMFHQEVVLGRGPDIFIWPHDRIGVWAQAGLVSPVTPSANTLDALDDSFWSAVSFNGEYYGYPIAVEGPTQICNAKLVNEVYPTLEAVSLANAELALQGVNPLLWDYNNTYFTYGFLSAEGGFAFEFTGGTYNPSITGINNSGSVTGATAIKEMIDTKILPEGMDYGKFDTAFKESKAACVINGPWSWESYKAAGIDMLIGPYPKVAEGEPSAFIGVLTAVVNASTPNKDIAKRFMEEYFLQVEGLKMVNDDKPLGAVTHKTFMASLAVENQLLADAYAVWQTSEPMPNIPKMGRFWTHTGPALSAITSGEKDVQTALDDAAARTTR